MKDPIYRNAFARLMNDLYHSDTDRGGRPGILTVTTMKPLLLQSVFNRVDDYERNSYVTGYLS